jgi:nucleoside-diphosphate-sugar epimerase
VRGSRHRDRSADAVAPIPGDGAVTRTALVTGGSGYFGALLVDHLLTAGYQVRVLDVVDAADRPAQVALVRGDIRDPAAVDRAVAGVEVVFHNVAQVPLARDRDLFESVNVGGTALLLKACENAGVTKVVHTSSSAVFGVPQENPVTRSTEPRPVEPYGRAKLDAELLCRAAASRGLDVSVVRPRTILGHGRLGIFGILFDWIADGASVPVLGSGDNLYQFVHAADLADACRRAGERPGPAVYNVGAERFGTMRAGLEALCEHAATGARVRSLPAGPTAAAMRLSSALGASPFAPYHWIMYGRSMWFDIEPAREELGWQPRWSNEEMLCDSYDWFLEHRHTGHPTGHQGVSAHRRSARQGLLRLVKRLL